MNSHKAIDILAGRLGVDAAEAGHLFDALSGSMVAELLDKGRLAVDGLGTFSIVHDHAVRAQSDKGGLFLPPRNRIAFESRRQSRGGDIARIASKRMGMDARQAQEFAAVMTACFKGRIKESLEIDIRGLGSFSVQNGAACGFRPDPALEELLNSAYEGLGTIIMPAVKEPGGWAAENAGGRPGAAWWIAGSVATLLIAGIFLFSNHTPYTSVQSAHSGEVKREAAGHTSPKSAPPVARPAGTSAPPPAGMLDATPHEEVNASPPGRLEAAPADSVTLGKDRYTVVVATFRTVAVARQEIHQLNQGGHHFLIWPVRSDKERFFRLVTGDFNSYRSAKERMEMLPSSLAKSSYIQKASKNVMLYGEKGL